MQTFVTREEIDPVKTAGMIAGEALRKLERLSDAARNAAVLLRHRRIRHPIELPIIQMMRVDEAADYQSADEIDGESGALVAAQHQPRVRCPRFRRELGMIDQIAAIT